MRKLTEELLNELMAAPCLDLYIKENAGSFIDCTLAQALGRLAAEKGLQKSAVIRNADINEIYGYQIFAGKRMPSRDKLLCLCLGLSLTAAETQQLLKLGGFAPLYPKSRRDSIILYGIGRGLGVMEINEHLYGYGEATL